MLPPPSLKYLAVSTLPACVHPSPLLIYGSIPQRVPSVSHAIINFLTALSVVQGGVREILPFIRYISQYIDFEFGAIKNMDRGKGVVCAATW